MGTSIVISAQDNGIRLYPNNLNGNPHYIKKLSDGNYTWGEPIKYWEYDKEELKEFIEECGRKNVQLLCSESGFPCSQQLEKVSGVEYFTILRNPFDRFVSNFRYDVQEGHTKTRSLADYYKSINDPTVQPNYYTNILSQGTMDFNKAVETLKIFNVIIIQEDVESLQLLRCMGFLNLPGLHNKSHYMSNDSVKIDNQQFLENIFRPENEDDYKLYSLASIGN
jgi:hypothetical protein